MTELTSFGNYIDTIVQLKHKPLESKKGLTDYISKDLAGQSSLSGRQIQRMRAYQEEEFPEGDAVMKLIKALPELEALRPTDICNRLLLPWQIIQKDQDQLAEHAIADGQNNQITIVAGWEPPQGLLSEEIAISIANNIVRNFKYEFIYPHLQSHPSLEEKQAESLINKWLRSLGRIIEIGWYSQQAEKFKLEKKASMYDPYNLDNNDNEDYDLEAELRNFKTKLAENIEFTTTPVKTNFWLLMPSPYVVLYNLNHSEFNPSLRFGVFLIEGIITQSLYEDIQPINSKGWLYLSREQYSRISQEYENIKNLCNRKSLKNLVL